MATKVSRFTISNQNPVGMIVSSMLTEAQFQTINGTTWVLADGRSVAGTQYATITGSPTIPDLRGVVLRGKNNGRSDGSQNPDGDSALGALQAHATNSHGHRVYGEGGGGGPLTNMNNAGTRGFLASSGANALNYVTNTQAGAGVAFIESTGGNETRTTNVTVNRFIKINP